jgi:hypothetical protein
MDGGERERRGNEINQILFLTALVFHSLRFKLRPTLLGQINGSPKGTQPIPPSLALNPLRRLYRPDTHHFHLPVRRILIFPPLSLPSNAFSYLLQRHRLSLTSTRPGFWSNLWGKQTPMSVGTRVKAFTFFPLHFLFVSLFFFSCRSTWRVPFPSLLQHRSSLSADVVGHHRLNSIFILFSHSVGSWFDNTHPIQRILLCLNHRT